MNWIAFYFSVEQTVQFEKNLDTFHQPIKCQDKWKNRVLANQVAAIRELQQLCGFSQTFKQIVPNSEKKPFLEAI